MSSEGAMPLKFGSVIKVHKGAPKSMSFNLLTGQDQSANGL